MTETSRLKQLLSDEYDPDVATVICGTCAADIAEGLDICPVCGGKAVLPTIGDLEKRLPIGMDIDGSLQKSFDMVPLNFNLTRKIDRVMIKARRDIPLHQYISLILAHTLTSIGDRDLTKFNIDRIMSILDEMYAGDIYYMYAYLRIITLGNTITLKGVECPSGKHSFTYPADLSSLGIVTYDSVESITKSIKLRDGIEMGSNIRMTLKMRPTKWKAARSMNASNAGESDFFASMMETCVVGIDDLPEGAQITSLEVAKMSQYDIKLCQEAINLLEAGPRWFVEGNCPKCGEHFYYALDWTYDSFFELSYTSPRRRSHTTK